MSFQGWQARHRHLVGMSLVEHGCLVIEQEREDLAAEVGRLRKDADSQRDRAELYSRMLTRCDEACEQVIAERDRERERADRLEQGMRQHREDHRRAISRETTTRHEMNYRKRDANERLWALLDSDGDSEPDR